MTMLTLVDQEYLPPDLLLDETHPAADAFSKAARRIQQYIVATSAKLHPRHVQAVKLHHKGQRNVQIAETLRVTPPSIARWLKKPDALKLKSLLAHYQAHIDGPNLALRQHMLWRIAHNNEVTHPRTSIAALAEINRMNQHNDNPAQQNGSGGVTIVINPNQFPRGALDQ